MSPVPPACRAPAVSLYLTTAGDVLACCQSTPAPLGNVTREPLGRIWAGERAEAVRRDLAAGSLPPGCRFCAWQHDEGGAEAMYARNFDRFALPEDRPGWPRQIEFALSNRCNLACVMCNGDLSSTIRARRERRSPLPKVYDDAFFADLRPFLVQLDQARFLGGEPFLIAEYQRIWDDLVDLGRPVACDVTTNGTVWTDRMARTLDALPFSIAVSIDGMRRETVEAVRVGADYDVVMANTRRFAAYCERAGTPFALTYCLLRTNWQELPEYLAFAADLGADVFVNTVTWPYHLSLYDLPVEDRRRIADALEADGATRVPGHPVLAEEVARLRAHDGQVDAPWFERWSPVPVVLRRRNGARSRADALARLGDGAEVDELVTDAADVVVAVGASGRFLGTDGADLVGRSYREALEAPTGRLGPLILVSDADATADDAERLLLYDGPDGQTRVHAVTVVERDDAGAVHRSVTFATVVDEFPALTATTS